MSLTQERLYEAVEKGLLPADDTLRVPAHKVQARRQEILVEVARKRDRGQIALAKLSPKQITTFCAALRGRLLDPDTGFGKAYVNLLVHEIRLEGNELKVRGSYDALAQVVGLGKKGKLEGVPSFIPEWRPYGDSNPGYRRERDASPSTIIHDCQQDP